MPQDCGRSGVDAHVDDKNIRFVGRPSRRRTSADRRDLASRAHTIICSPAAPTPSHSLPWQINLFFYQFSRRPAVSGGGGSTRRDSLKVVASELFDEGDWPAAADGRLFSHGTAQLLRMRGSASLRRWQPTRRTLAAHAIDTREPWNRGLDIDGPGNDGPMVTELPRRCRLWQRINS